MHKSLAQILELVVALSCQWRSRGLHIVPMNVDSDGVETCLRIAVKIAI